MGFVNRVRLSLEDYFSLDKNRRMTPEGEMVRTHDDHGRELPDPVPVAPPIGWFKQPSMFDNIRNMVRSEHMRMYAESQGAETFEDAQDFDVEDEMFPASQYEGEFEPMEDLQAARQARFRQRWLDEHEQGEYGQWVETERAEGRIPASPVAPAAPKARPASPPPRARQRRMSGVPRSTVHYLMCTVLGDTR